jgi:hypothetical protein
MQSMLFVVRKRELQHAISVLRDDRRQSKHPGTFMRFEARYDFLAISSWDASAQIAATVYEPGVVFLRTGTFRKLLPTIRETQFLEIHVRDGQLLLDNVRLAIPPEDVLLHSEPEAAPARHPADARPSGPKRPRQYGYHRQLWLWEDR